MDWTPVQSSAFPIVFGRRGAHESTDCNG